MARTIQFTPEQESDICHKYLALESLRDIAKYFDCSVKPIKRVLDKHNIELRPNTQQRTKPIIDGKKQCAKCKNWIETNSFDSSGSWCSPCGVNYRRERERALRRDKATKEQYNERKRKERKTRKQKEWEKKGFKGYYPGTKRLQKEDGTIHCSRCNNWKSIDEFGTVNSTPKSYCKDCVHSYVNNWINTDNNLILKRAYHSKYKKTSKGKASNTRRREYGKNLDSKWNYEKQIIIDSLYPTCVKCGSTDNLATDHLFPLSKGFGLTLINAIKLCPSCNSSKKDKHPKEFFSDDEWISIINKTSPLKDFYRIRQVEYKDISNIISSYHYSKTCPSGAFYFGLYVVINGQEDLVGGAVFRLPSRQNLPYDLDFSRLFVFDGTPKNIETFFISKCINFIKKAGFKGTIVSYADPTEGHNGTIYKAANWVFQGLSSSSYHYETIEGKRLTKKPVWERAKANKVSESKQAEIEGLIKVTELPKLIFTYTI